MHARRLGFLLLFALPLSVFAGSFSLSSPGFAQGGPIPARFTCDGRNVSPALEIAGVPAGAVSLVLIVDDPDAPPGTFTHWLVWNIPIATKKIAEGAVPRGALQGTNDFGAAGYSGPCPPSGTHRYFFRLYAVSGTLPLPAGASRKALDTAISGNILGTAILMGHYARGGFQ